MRTFFNWFVSLDRVLRGEATQLSTLRSDTIPIPLFGLSFVIILLGMIYGACMGCYSLLRPDGPVYDQVLASTVKVPALFFCTLIVTFPSLYVFNALVGSRLSLSAVLKLLIAAGGVNLAVLSSLGPVVAFFSVSTTSYSFMVILNVIVFAVAGLLGLSFLLQTLHRLSVQDQMEEWRLRSERARQFETPQKPEGAELPVLEATTEEATAPASEIAPAGQSSVAAAPLEPPAYRPDDPHGALDRLQGQMLGAPVKAVFRIWLIVFGLVGAQMSWLLRPFIGSPDAPFQWLRPRGGNFFESVYHVIQNLISP